MLQDCKQGEVLLGVGGKGISGGCLSPGPGCAAWGPPWSWARVCPVHRGFWDGMGEPVPRLGITVEVCPVPTGSWVGMGGSIPRLEVTVGACPTSRGSPVGTGGVHPQA